MKQIKNILILTSALLLGLAACKDKLAEVRPETSLDPSVILADASSAYALYNGVYVSLRGYQYQLFTLGEMRSETWSDGIFTESEDGTFRQFWAQDFSEANAPFSNWGGFYSLLNRVNTVITLFPNAPLEATVRDRYRGEMYGLRAYVYYNMLRTWGGVPIATQPLKEIGDLSALYQERATPEMVMQQIKADIDSSLALIGPNVSYATPANPGNNKRVYWNRAATLTLKGDVFLWSGTHMGGGSGDFTTSKTALEEVRDNALFSLQPNYADIFDPLKENGNKEIIFAINYEKDQGTLGTYGGSFSVNTTQRSTLIFNPENPVNVVSAYPYVAGANRVGLSPKLITKLTGTTPPDSRMAATFRTLHNNSAPYALRGVLLTKFLGRADPISSSQIYDTDFSIYRYADVLLLLAEAKTKLGESPATEINAIRQRAYGPKYAPVIVGSEMQNLNTILDEYQREFIGEGRYWWAERRAGDAFVYDRIDPKYLSSAQSYKLLLPISVTMLNNDPKLKQTPGY